MYSSNSVQKQQDTCDVYCCEIETCTGNWFKYVGAIKSCSAYLSDASDLNNDSPITAEYILDDYFDCIGDVGTLPSTYHIELKENAQPVVVPPRKLPFAMK